MYSRPHFKTSLRLVIWEDVYEASRSNAAQFVIPLGLCRLLYEDLQPHIKILWILFLVFSRFRGNSVQSMGFYFLFNCAASTLLSVACSVTVFISSSSVPSDRGHLASLVASSMLTSVRPEPTYGISTALCNQSTSFLLSPSTAMSEVRPCSRHYPLKKCCLDFHWRGWRPWFPRQTWPWQCTPQLQLLLDL